MRSARKNVHIFIISDSTGMTAEMVINAVLVQFKGIRPLYRKFPYVKTKEEIRAILGQACAVQGIVIYSVVSPELRAAVRRERRTMDIYTIDLLGPILDRIRKQWDLLPLLKPGLLRGTGEESLRLAEAIDFTLKHDDGQGVDTLGRADLVILGVSRTSKTPTSLYLSCNHGLKVANVPIIPGMRPPGRVFSSKNRKVGFTIEPDRLAFIRRRRMKYSEAADYLDITHIKNELDYSRQIFSRIEGLQIIDVSHSSIEEVAGWIMEMRREIPARHED